MNTEMRRRGGAEENGVIRERVRERGAKYPMVEEMFVAAPAVVADKSRPGFDDNWRKLTGPGLF